MNHNMNQHKWQEPGLENEKKINRFTPSRIDILTFLFLRSSCIIIVPKPVNNVIFFYFFAYNNNNNKVQRFLYSKKEKEKNIRKSGILTRCA